MLMVVMAQGAREVLGGVRMVLNLAGGWALRLMILSVLFFSKHSIFAYLCPIFSIQDSDYGMRTPRKPFMAGAAGGMFGGAVAGGGMMPSDLVAAAGTPSNLGKIGDAGAFILFCCL